jgi:hypothetical protein
MIRPVLAAALIPRNDRVVTVLGTASMRRFQVPQAIAAVNPAAAPARGRNRAIVADASGERMRHQRDTAPATTGCPACS